MMSEAGANSLEILETADGSCTLRSLRFDATYHAVQGAEGESSHVFIGGGLQSLLSDSPAASLNILEIGFGTGLNAFLTLQEIERAHVSVDYHAVELYPVPIGVAAQLPPARHKVTTLRDTFLRMHTLPWGTTENLSPQFRFSKHLLPIEEFRHRPYFDLIYFDAFSPKEQPELWTESVFRNMYESLKPQGRLVTYCAQGQMKRNLKAAGFRVKAQKGFAAKREMTLAVRD